MLLVGDEPYYGPLGFKKVPRGQLSMPRPVDLDRILAVELKPGAVAALKGMVDHEDLVRAIAFPAWQVGCGSSGQSRCLIWRIAVRGRQLHRPSRYHIEPSASSSRPRPKKPPNSGTRDTDFSTLSLVVLQADPVAAGGVGRAAHRHDAGQR